MRTAAIGGALLVLGAVAMATGILAPADAIALANRVWPILLFVVAITIVTELAASAGLFAFVAEHLARWGASRAWLLWLMIVALAAVSTIFLSLDTTAVLLTPVVIAVARHVGLPPIPFAMTSVWLANTASLLLPVSNLTNLLAATALHDYSPLRFAALMVAPAAVAIVVPSILLFLVYRRSLLGRYELPVPEVAEDRVLLVASGVVVAAVLPALVSGTPVWIPATIAAIILGSFFAVRKPAVLRFGLVPWQLVLFAGGLFVVFAALGAIGLDAVLGVVAGKGDGFWALLRLAGVGATSANLVDNLPSFLALQPSAQTPARIAALLIGVNAGPLITPWASLATLLWAARLRQLEVEFSWRAFIGLGLIAAPLTVGLAVLALAIAG